MIQTTNQMYKSHCPLFIYNPTYSNTTTFHLSQRPWEEKSQVLLGCAMVKDHGFGGWLWSSYHTGLLTMDRLVDLSPNHRGNDPFLWRNKPCFGRGASTVQPSEPDQCDAKQRRLSSLLRNAETVLRHSPTVIAATPKISLDIPFLTIF